MPLLEQYKGSFDLLMLFILPFELRNYPGLRIVPSQTVTGESKSWASTKNFPMLLRKILAWIRPQAHLLVNLLTFL